MSTKTPREIMRPTLLDIADLNDDFPAALFQAGRALVCLGLGGTLREIGIDGHEEIQLPPGASCYKQAVLAVAGYMALTMRDRNGRTLQGADAEIFATALESLPPEIRFCFRQQVKQESLDALRRYADSVDSLARRLVVDRCIHWDV